MNDRSTHTADNDCSERNRAHAGSVATATEQRQPAVADPTPTADAGRPPVQLGCRESSGDPELFDAMLKQTAATHRPLATGGTASTGERSPDIEDDDPSSQNVVLQRPEYVGGAASADPGWLTDAATKPLDAARPLGLFVIRESDEWDLELFNAMREQTYVERRELEPVEAIRKVGLAPLKSDTFSVEWRGRAERVVVEELREGRTRAYLFHFRGYWHLWSQASAHRVDAGTADDRVNAFTAILVKVVRRLRPKVLHAANLSRLVRSTKQGNWLWSQLDGNIDALWVKEKRFDLTGESLEMSMMLLHMLSWTASLERDAIVQRLLAGRIAKWRRGEWAFGDATVPFGFKLESRRLVPDGSKRAAVREMMLVLSSDAPPSEKVRQLDAAGVTMMRRHRRLGHRTSIASAVNPDYAVSTLMAWAPLWICGEYLWRVTNSFPNMDELAGVPIVRYPRRVDLDGLPDPGELQMLYRVGLPEGGWAEDEIVDKFARAAIARSLELIERGRSRTRPIAQTVLEESSNAHVLASVLPADYAGARDRKSTARRDAARAKATISAFTGRGWREDDVWMELQMCGGGRYRLMRYPIDPDEPIEGTRRGNGKEDAR